VTPDDAAWYGPMVSIPLPPGDAWPLQQALRERYGIEVPIVCWQSRRYVRVPCYLYNRRADIERLAQALGELLG
jgi:isopenicillin-N epimerase